MYLTRQRKVLREYLSKHRDEQLSARQIAAELSGERISISAVYRNLSDLEKAGLVRRCVRENSNETYYQYIASDECRNNLHMSCRVCGKTVHLDEKDTAVLIDSALKKTGFKIDKSDTFLYGVCEKCGR